MLRMYFIAHWFNLADEACEGVPYDIAAFRDFCRVDLGREGVQAATSLLNFHHLLKDHKLGAALYAKVGELLLSNGLKLSGGSIVDATIASAPSSTKNKEKARDSEIHQAKKGNQWHFGMNVHIGVDNQSGLTHSASVTPANVHDSQELPSLLHGNKTRLYGDKEANRRKSQVRAKVEHPFRPFKNLYGFAKTRYRGLLKNANRTFALLALINLEKSGRPLTGSVCPV